MKKLLFVLGMLAVTFQSTAQFENNNGVYTVVFELDLSKKDIHQKINEWIAVNYKSAQDVIQLNTEDKVIVKGNYIVVMQNTPYRVNNSLSFSIRDNKYKLDLNPSNVSNSIVKLSDAMSKQITEIYSPPKLDKELYNEMAIKKCIS